MSEAVLNTSEVRRWKRYAELDDSIAFVGSTKPKHWLRTRLKFEGNLGAGAGFPVDEQGLIKGEFPFYKVQDMNHEGNEIFMVHHTNAISRETARQLRAPIFQPGTIVFPKVGATLLTNKRRILTVDSCIDNNVMGFTPHSGQAKFWHYLLSAIDLGELANPGALPSVNESQICNVFVNTPPIHEQRVIAAFLDRETARIDALVAKKQRLIELLEEKRRAIISQAVTKGLQQEEESRTSKLFWLDSFPCNWTMTRLKYIAEIQTGLTLGKNYSDRDLVERPYLRVANVQDGYLDLADITNVRVPADDVARHELQAGDVLMTEGGDFDKLGRGFVWEAQIPGCLHQNHVFAVRPKQDFLLPHYLAALMTSAHGKTYFTYTSQQSTNLASTNSTKLGNFPIPLPSVERQKSILQSIAERSGTINKCVKRIHFGISSLTEYRSALISAAVTGQIDVREEVQLDQ